MITVVSLLFTLDIDECVDESIACTQVCVNTIGSFQCSCSAGFQLGTDGQSCYRKLPSLKLSFVLMPSFQKNCCFHFFLVISYNTH